MNKKQIEKAAKGVVQLIAATEKDFESWTKKNQFKILKAISDEIRDGMPTQNGKVANNPTTQKFIAALPTKVRAALKKTGYLQKVDSYVRTFDKVGQLQIDLHRDVNSINAAPIVSPIQRVWAQVTADNLAGQGMDNFLVYPLQQSLLTHAASGVTLTELVNMIDDEMRGNAKNKNTVFGNQALQIGRDALGQYDGAINGKIAQQFDLNAIVYVGSVVDDTTRAM
jgi:ribosomal protein S8